MSATYGRFVLDEAAECVRLRVQSGDSVTLWRGAALGGAGLIAVLPTMAFSGPLMMTLSAILCFCLLGSSMAMAARAGVARSIYPRVRRLIEIHGKGDSGPGTSYREGGKALLVVDGRSFARSDVVGVVVAQSTEAVRMSGKVARKVSRYRPTLLLRESAFELDVMEASSTKDRCARWRGGSRASAPASARSSSRTRRRRSTARRERERLAPRGVPSADTGQTLTRIRPAFAPEAHPLRLTRDDPSPPIPTPGARSGSRIGATAYGFPVDDTVDEHEGRGLRRGSLEPSGGSAHR